MAQLWDLFIASESPGCRAVWFELQRLSEKAGIPWGEFIARRAELMVPDYKRSTVLLDRLQALGSSQRLLDFIAAHSEPDPQNAIITHGPVPDPESN